MTNINIEEITYEVVVQDGNEIINITLGTTSGIQSVTDTGSGNSLISNTTAATVTLKTLAAGNFITLTDDGETITVSTIEDDLSNNTTDDLSEGSANLYFTEQRVADVLADFTGNIIPSANNFYTLGTIDNVWKDVYIGPGSLYVDGQKIVSSDAGTIRITTDPGQNLTIEAGADISIIPGSATFNVTATDINLGPETGGTLVEVNGDITVDNMFSISDTQITDGLIEFTGIHQNAEIRTNGTGYVHLNTDAAYVGSLTSATKVSANTITTTAGDLNIGAGSGTVTVEGFTNTIGMTTAIQTAKNEAISYTDTSIANLIDTAPATLDTLNELAAALGDDPNFATTVTNELALKLNASDFGSEFDTNFALKTTSDLPEGSNLYYTNNRVTTWLDGNATRFSNDNAGGNTSIEMLLQDDIFMMAESVRVGSFGQHVAISSNGQGNRVFGVGGTLAVTGTVSDISNHNLTDLGDVSAPFGLNGGEIIVNMPGMGWVATPITTDDLNEGTTNLYYTDARVQSVIDAGGYLTSETDPIYTASSWYTTTNNSVNWDLAVSWGNHADAGYLTSIGDASIFDLTDVSAPFGVADNYLLVWNSGAGGFVAAPVTTDNLAEGTTNLYYTDARVDAYLESGAIDRIAFTNTAITWNADDGTLEFPLNAEVTLQIGQENTIFVRNLSGQTIVNGAVVRVIGASGNKLSVDLANNTSDSVSADTIAIATQEIGNNSSGYVTTEGLVRGLDTSALTEGAVLWLDGAGTFTQTKPQTPLHLVQVGYVVRSHATEGSIFVSIKNGWELDELHDVLITNVQNGDFIRWNGTAQYWENTAVDIADLTDNSGLLANDDLSNNSVFDLQDIVQIQPAGDGQILVYNSAAGGFVNTPITTDDLTEGSSNLYFTDQRAIDAVEGTTSLELNRVFVNEHGGSNLPQGGAWNNAAFKVYGDTSGAPAYFVRAINTAQYEPSFWGSNIYALQYDVDLTGVNLSGSSQIIAHQVMDRTGTPLNVFSYAAAIDNVGIVNGNIDEFTGRLDFVVQDKASGGGTSGPTVLSMTSSEAQFNVPVKIDTINSPSGTLNVNNGVNVNGAITIGGQSLTTSFIPEGTNLYYTDQRADDRISAASIMDLGDVLQIQPLGDGQILGYSAAAGNKFVNFVPFIDNLADVDTSTTAPSVDDVLVWDGSNWVPSDVLVGMQAAIDAILGA